MEHLTLNSIQIYSKIYDKKIQAYNISFELSKEDYLAFASIILNKNEYQRKKIKGASSVYSLMKSDLKKGCIIPPIVLALGTGNGKADENKKDLEKFIEGLAEEDFHISLKDFLEKNINHIKILDGLQRTNMLLDVKNDLEKNESKDNEDFKNFYATKLRFEIYLGINSFGILYRMLTLNTGQSPMSLRHQIEILYSDFFKQEGIEGEIYLIREVDTYSRVALGKYHFDDLLQGLDAYIDGQEFTLDRKDILKYVKDLENLSTNLAPYDLFEEFVKTYHSLVLKIQEIASDWVFSYENLTHEEQEWIKGFFPETQKNEENIANIINKSAFGKNVIEIFTASQVVTGMGAALHKLDLLEAQKTISKLFFENNSTKALDKLTYYLFHLKANSKRIGDTQRTFFKEFFKRLLRIEGCSFEQALEDSYRWMLTFNYLPKSSNF